MNRYMQAIERAQKQGYLVTGSGQDWLVREVAWRRHCLAQGEPTVVVSRRKKLADISIYLGKIPHIDATDTEIKQLVHTSTDNEIDEGQINILRGRRGLPRLFVGLCVSDVLIDQAEALAPSFVAYARSLLPQDASSQ